MYKKIRAYLHPSTQNQIHYIDVPIDGGINRITKKHDMEQVLLNFHKSHFYQAKNTPFTHPDFMARFGSAADTLHATHFRAGDPSEAKFWPNKDEKQFLNQSWEDLPPEAKID